MGFAVEATRVLSLIPGRMRLHVPGSAGAEPGRVEARLRQVPGVETVQANPMTGNVLIRYDPRPAGPSDSWRRWTSDPTLDRPRSGGTPNRQQRPSEPDRKV
jgi:hypothetical protein